MKQKKKSKDSIKTRKVLLWTLIPISIIGIALATALPITLCRGSGGGQKNFSLSTELRTSTSNLISNPKISPPSNSRFMFLEKKWDSEGGGWYTSDLDQFCFWLNVCENNGPVEPVTKNMITINKESVDVDHSYLLSSSLTLSNITVSNTPEPHLSVYISYWNIGGDNKERVLFFLAGSATTEYHSTDNGQISFEFSCYIDGYPVNTTIDLPVGLKTFQAITS